MEWNLLTYMPMFSTALITLKIIKSLHEKVKYYTACEAQFCAIFIWNVQITPMSTTWRYSAIMVIKLNSTPCHVMICWTGCGFSSVCGSSEWSLLENFPRHETTSCSNNTCGLRSALCGGFRILSAHWRDSLPTNVWFFFVFCLLSVCFFSSVMTRPF